MMSGVANAVGRLKVPKKKRHRPHTAQRVFVIDQDEILEVRV
jgi:hypothetical protein